MVLQLFLTGETPSKKNSRVTDTRTGRTFPNARYRKWENEKINEVRLQYQGEPIDGPLNIDMIFYHTNKKVRDCDNPVNSVLDMLKKAGVLKDDRWTLVPLHKVLHKLSEGEGCEIVITDYKGAL